MLEIENHFDGRCQPVEGITGGEDMTIDRATGLVYISSDDPLVHDGRQPTPGKYLCHGAGRSTALPISLTPNSRSIFHPHGLSLYRSAEGDVRLFVINHRDDGTDWVEIFKVNAAQPLTHLRSIACPELISP